MEPLFIFFTISKTGAVVFIVALLLVAAVIGYLTSWLYAKSVYTPIIKRLESEKADLIRQVDGLKDDIRKLNGTIGDLQEKITRLEKETAEKENEIIQLKKINEENENELQQLRKKNKE